MSGKSKHYYHKDRNEDRWKVPKNTKFEWHLEKVVDQVTTLLKEKNAAL